MKIKLLKDIPGYKAGEIMDGSFMAHQYNATILIAEGWAEEIKDDIDIEEIRKNLRATIVETPMLPNRYVMPPLTEDEISFFTAYRIVKAVIEKLNGDWKVEKDDNGYAYIAYWRNRNEFMTGTYNNDYVETRIPECRNEEIAQQVISLCESELEVLFGVK